MIGINEGGMTANDIAKIICEMRPARSGKKRTKEQLKKDGLTKKCIDDVLYNMEMKRIDNGESLGKSIYIAETPRPVHPNSVAYSRKGGNKGWTDSNGFHFK